MRLKAGVQILICGLIILLGAGVRAEEKSEGTEGEAPKEGGGAADRPWQETENRLSVLRTKNAQLDKSLKILIEERRHNVNPSRISGIEKEIDKTYREFQKANAELRKQEEIYRYRFPERTAKEKDRTYHTEQIQSLDKIEEQVGIDGKINRNLRRMRQQFGTAAERKKVGPAEKPVPKPTPEEKNIHEQDSVILKK